ncbi:MAG: rane protein [Actinoallomurus sp.]|nr:rane protein [Actinoallomurus sp.]
MFMIVVAPILIGLLYVFLMSVLREPARRRFNAIMVAGAGAAYLSSGAGFGPWEFVFTAAITYCAYRGLESYVWTGIAWLLHAAWDILHYLRGAPIIPFASHSSFGCAICDPVIAIWCLRSGPSLPGLIKSWFSRRPASASDATGS